MKWRGRLLGLACLLAAVPLLLAAEPARAAGATYYFSPSTIRLNVGQTAVVSLFISSPDEAINAGDGTIVLPAAYTSGISVSKSGSIFTLWPEDPSISGSTIRFAGGKAAPGYQGAGGKVLNFTIRGSAEGTGIITLTGGRILANNASSTNIYAGAGNATVTVTRTVSGATISSTTHPDPNAWYKVKDAAVSWTKPSGATSFSYTLTHSGSEPAKSGSGAATSATFSGLADGIWTLSLTTTFSDGKTATSSYTLKVDTTPPAPFTFTSERLNGALDPQPVLKFQTTDQPSGVVRYEIIIDGKEPIVTTETTYKLPVQKPGKHNVVVRAVDAAGNTTDATGQFTVEGFPGPVITDWPRIIAVLEPISLKGTARYDSKVLLYVDGELVGEFNVKDNLSDDAKKKVDLDKVQPDEIVEWSYTHHGPIIRGTHLIYAEQQRPDGALSNRSNEVRTFVLWTSIYIFNRSIPTFLVGVILILILSLLIIAISFRYRRLLAAIKRRVRRAEEKVDDDLEALEGQLGKDNSRANGSIELARADIAHQLDGIFKKDDKKK